MIDVQVVTDGRNLDKINNDKINKYRRQDLLDEIRKQKQVNQINVLAVTLNFRGIWSPVSASAMIDRKILSKNDKPSGFDGHTHLFQDFQPIHVGRQKSWSRMKWMQRRTPSTDESPSKYPNSLIVVTPFLQNCL